VKWILTIIAAIVIFLTGFFTRNIINPQSSLPSQSILSPTPTRSIFTVVEVLDGDTIRIDTGELVRYLGIDAPEKNEKMIEEGYATFYTIPKTRKLKYADRLQRAQQWAKDHHNGMWLEEWKTK